MALKTLTTLPPLVVSLADVGRLLHELEVIDEMLLQLDLRTEATNAVKQHGRVDHQNVAANTKLPRVSHWLEQTAQLNQLNLLQAADRAALQHSLTTIKEQSPVLHISFSAEPAPAFIEKLVIWLRGEIHPGILLTIGLQPTIGAGCIVRSTNKQFDFSLRQAFLKKRQLLLAALLPPITESSSPLTLATSPVSAETTEAAAGVAV